MKYAIYLRDDRYGYRIFCATVTTDSYRDATMMAIKSCRNVKLRREHHLDIVPLGPVKLFFTRIFGEWWL